MEFIYTTVIVVIINGPVRKFQRLALIQNADLLIGINNEYDDLMMSSIKIGFVGIAVAILFLLAAIFV